MSSGHVTPFWEEKYTKESGKNWNLFYKRNGDRFYKDRQWTDREFEELKSDTSQVLLEVGCGVGNFVFPLLEKNPKLTIHCCDISPKAIELVNAHENFELVRGRCFPFVCDLVSNNLTDHVSPASVDIVSAIFVISAIHPKFHAQVFANISKILKKDGLLIFRDYAVGDHAQYRFKDDRKINDELFVRQDGTLSYFFSKEYLHEALVPLGFSPIVNEYVTRKTVNVKEDLDLDRTFLQSKWKYSGPSASQTTSASQ